MNKEIRIALAEVKEILDDLPSRRLPDEQVVKLEIARQLVDLTIMIDNQLDEYRKQYLADAKALLPEIRLAIAESSTGAPADNVEELLASISSLTDVKEDDVFDHFQAQLVKLQSALDLKGVTDQNAPAFKLAQLDYRFAKEQMTAVESLARDDSEEEGAKSGAVNIKEFDRPALQAFIKAQFPDETSLEIADSGFISGGHSKFTLALSLAGNLQLPDAIILRGEASNRFSGAGVKDEFPLQKILFDHGIAVPEPLALEASGDVWGAPFLLCRKARGGTIGHMFDLPRQKNDGTCADIGRHLAKIHQIPVADFGDQVANAGKKTSVKVHEWLDIGIRDLEGTELSSTVFELAFSWLRANAEINDRWPQTLVHGDFGLNNILIDDGRVSAILDWEFAHIGNPAYDLGYFYYMAEALGSWEIFLDAYVGAGASLPDQNQLNYNLLFAATRLGVMTGQSYAAIMSRQVKGAHAARGISHQYFQESIRRIYGCLERVL